MPRVAERRGYSSSRAATPVAELLRAFVTQSNHSIYQQPILQNPFLEKSQ
jgi:hypothetical protein